MSELDPLWQKFLDPRMPHEHKIILLKLTCLSIASHLVIYYVNCYQTLSLLIAHLSDIRMFNNDQISHNAHSAHARWCNKADIVWLCVCTGDKLAKARGLSSRTYAQTMQ